MLVSIITVSLNNIAELEKTIESVLSQSYKSREHTIIDGGSTDGTVQLLEKHSENLGYWVCEKDTGIYNAMNKGIRASKGDYLIFLNSGDSFYSPDSIAELIDSSNDKDIIYGNL